MNHFESFNPWRPRPSPSLSLVHRQWLTRPGALTQALREVGRLELRVLAEYPDGAHHNEAQRLAVNDRSPVWVREVVMRINGIECVAARSVTPLMASHGTWQGIRRLRSRPLADILYNDVAITRSDFEVSRLNRQTDLFKTVRSLSNTWGQAASSPRVLLARRSVFWRQGTPLLVAECFLPDFWRLISQAADLSRD